MPSEVKANIDYALRRAAEVDADHIKVKVVDDKVILNGKCLPGRNAAKPSASPGRPRALEP